ncbi:MAG: hypothetical protein ABI402_05205 [Ferruginibacter sp.]
MQELFNKMSFFAVVYALLFGAIYLYGRKSFPKLSLWLTVGAWVLLMIISYYNGMIAGLLATVTILVFFVVLKKPNGNPALQQFYSENKIYSTKIYSQAALDILGDKNWRYAEGTINKNVSESIKYQLWMGYIKSTVSAGQYTRTTTFTNYLAFIFPPGSASNIFKQRAITAADKSTYSSREKLKYFFSMDTDKPCRILNATDGSFIVEYLTVPDVENYSKQLNWIKENFGMAYVSVTQTKTAN